MISLESEGLRIKLQDVFELTRCALREESCCVFHGSHCDNWASTNGRWGAALTPMCTIHVFVAPPQESLSSFSFSFLFYLRPAMSHFLSFSLSHFSVHPSPRVPRERTDHARNPILPSDSFEFSRFHRRRWYATHAWDAFTIGAHTVDRWERKYRR